ncbi:MAG: hypothetical protein AAFU85_05570 [Planctomycetota bacterium]
MLSTMNITIESVHGLKETVVISRDGVRPAGSQTPLSKAPKPDELRRASETNDRR